ncbi:MAG: PAS domain S-box protein, partial [Acidobacteriales bacterium]|nr:PAS domain S-box protein [Terriglobales bacterium]
VRTYLGDPVLSTATVPLKLPGRDTPAGFLVTGVNPRRELDGDYQSLLTRAAGDIATALAGLRALNAERRRAEALAELDRAKTSFFSNVSHEFRTPLTLMLGPLEELVAESGAKVEADREQIDMVYRNGLRMLKLVNALLDFSRIEAGRVLANYEATDLAILTQDLTSVFRSAIERAGLKLVVEIPALPEPVYVDRDMWEKIVLNLLSNALKFTTSGEIRVGLRPSAEAVALTVADTGAGIPAKELPRIFDRFHRVENVRARTHEGSGIGLALVQELVRLHGGTIAARSSEGQGAEFTVQLPFGSAHLPQERIRETRNLAATALGATPFVEEALRWLPEETERPSTKEFSQASHQAGTEPRPQDETQARILVADDNADMRDYLRRLLGERYTVEVVDNGEAALLSARRQTPDLIVSDIMMPRMTGIELLRALREDPVLSGVQVMLVSARAEAEAQMEGLDSGADYLVKPFTSRELLPRVGSHLRLARFQQSWAERERELRRQAELGRRRLEELFMQAPVAIAVLSGPEHCWTFANPEYLRLAGVERQQDLLGKPIRETMAELDEQPFFDLLDQVYRFGVPYHGKEMKVVWKTEKPGRQLEGYFNFVYQPMRTSSGEVEGILVHTVDVTEQVQARHAVEQAQDQFRNFFRRAPVGAALIDFASSNILEINDTFLEMIGYSREEVVGKTTLWFTHREDRERQAKALADYQAHPTGTFRMEKRYACKDGRTIWVQTASNPVRDSQASQPIYSVAVAAD